VVSNASKNIQSAHTGAVAVGEEFLPQLSALLYYTEQKLNGKTPESFEGLGDDVKKVYFEKAGTVEKIIKKINYVVVPEKEYAALTKKPDRNRLIDDITIEITEFVMVLDKPAGIKNVAEFFPARELAARIVAYLK